MENIIEDSSEQSLRLQNEHLKDQLISAALINELIKVLHSCTDLQGIVKTVLLSFQDLVDFDRAMLFSINKKDFCIEPQSWVGMSDDAVKGLSIGLGFDGGDITDAIFLNRHIFVEETDPAYDIFSLRLQSKSYIVIPLLKKPTRKCWEIRNCAKKSCNCYGSVNPYCWSNANEVLRSTNYELELAQHKIRIDLEQARSIQQRLLPQDIESSKDYSVSTCYLAANTVGGDYYDLFKAADNVYGLIVADVSGHGIASALIMSMAKMLLKTYSKDELSPKRTLERINEAFLSEVATEHFVTIFYAIFDVQKMKIRYTSAGHCPILYINKKNGTCDLLKADGLFLGVFPDMMLSEKELDYVRGEHRLILYTDGLTEAINANAEMYGAERLISAACNTYGLDSNEALEAILKDQRDFCGQTVPEDDVTLLIIDF
jgi:serine phosphatase RsbU (regulator of sigma subunit)